MWYWPALSLKRELETLTWSRKSKGRKSDSVVPPVRPFRRNRGRTRITLVSSYRRETFPIYSTNCPDGRREARAWKADWVFWLSQLREQQPLDLEAQVSTVIYILGRAHKSLFQIETHKDEDKLKGGIVLLMGVPRSTILLSKSSRASFSCNSASWERMLPEALSLLGLRVFCVQVFKDFYVINQGYYRILSWVGRGLSEKYHCTLV